jgi:acetolactate synthase-1/2/3 large subunit
MPTLADGLVEAFREWGLRYLFGVSGANIEHLHDAVHRRGGLTSVLAKREDGAAFMADAHARVHRTLGLCCATSGGGMMNLAVGLAESLTDGVPVLAVIGQPPSALDGAGSFQESTGRTGTVDALGLLGAVTKHVARVADRDQFWAALRAAARAALSGRPGPAALLIPRDVFPLEVGGPPVGWPRELGDVADAATPDVIATQRLFDAIRSARRPVLLIGHEVRASRDERGVHEFARRARIPVATTMSARGDFPNADPLHLGVAGACGHPSVHEFLLSQADLVIAAGTELGMLVRAPLTGLPGSRVAAVTHDGSVARAAFPGAVVIEGDAGVVFRQLCGMLDRTPFTAAPLNGYRLRRYAPQLEQPGVAAPGGDTLLASEAVAVLERYLPSGGHILTDAGKCGAAAMHRALVPPGTSTTVAFGMGGMGYSLPGAIGAQLGSPGRTVVCCGDGSFLMNGFEIHTAVELRLPILYVVFNNQGHGMCVSRQRLMFGDRVECATYGPVDIPTIARGLGGPDALWVGSAGTATELEYVLEDYHTRCAARPGVLELRLPREEIPPMVPFTPADAPAQDVVQNRQRVAPWGSAVARPTAV